MTQSGPSDVQDHPDVLPVHEELLRFLVAFEAADPAAERGSEILLIGLNGGVMIVHRPGHRDQLTNPVTHFRELERGGLIRFHDSPKNTFVCSISAAGYRWLDRRAAREASAVPAAAGGQKDVFISYASEDRATVDELTAALERLGVSCWRDQVEIEMGEPINRAIDDGINHSRFGIPILSRSYFAKPWPNRELDGLIQLETTRSGYRVLPIWHGVSSADVIAQSPTLAAKKARSTSNTTMAAIADEIAKVVKGDAATRLSPSVSPPPEPGEVLPVPAATASRAERESVAIHWVGEGSGHYVPGMSADPTATQFVTLTRARELLSMRGNEELPLFELGPAPDHDPEAQRDIRLARRGLADRVAAGEGVVAELTELSGEDLLPLHVPYWEQRIQGWDQDATSFMLHSAPGWRVGPAIPGWGDLKGQSDWRGILLESMKERVDVFGKALRGLGTEHIGYRSRRADPTTVVAYTSRWGRQVEFRASADGVLRPRNKEEVRLLDNMGFPPAD